MSSEQEHNAELQTENQDRVSSIKGIFEVFSDPESFFGKLKDDPKVLIPYLVFLTATIIFSFATSDLMLAMLLEQEGIAEQIDSGVLTPRILQISNLVMVPIVVGLIPIVAAALGMFWGNFVFAGNAKFKQVLSVMTYGSLVHALGFLLVIPLMMASDSFLASFSFAAFLSEPELNSVLFVFLSKINLFIIWEIIVIGIGLSVLYKKPRNKGYLLSVLSMGMLPILDVVQTAFKSMFF